MDELKKLHDDLDHLGEEAFMMLASIHSETDIWLMVDQLEQKGRGGEPTLELLETWGRSAYWAAMALQMLRAVKRAIPPIGTNAEGVDLHFMIRTAQIMFDAGSALTEAGWSPAERYAVMGQAHCANQRMKAKQPRRRELREMIEKLVLRNRQYSVAELWDKFQGAIDSKFGSVEVVGNPRQKDTRRYEFPTLDGKEDHITFRNFENIVSSIRGGLKKQSR